MGKLIIHNQKIDAQSAQRLVALCPFGAFEYDGATLTANAACRLCKLCVKESGGLIEYEEDAQRASADKDAWRGIAVYAEQLGGAVAPVAFELLGKARELAKTTGHPVYALLIGSGMEAAAKQLSCYGADAVYVYDHPELEQFRVQPYAAAFSDFVNQIKPSSVLVGATNLGRSLAPRVAARFATGLTADCTRLEIKQNTDLVQIRPAFGGNIMAQIVTPNHRPQFCTVRYKIFSAPPKGEATGKIVALPVQNAWLNCPTQVLRVETTPAQIDISEAQAIVAVGRGVKSQKDLALAQRLSHALGAQMACTRPLIENGWFDPRRQIGLSGRTVKPKIIVTLGISGSVQFAAGMQSADCIVAVNQDARAPIFDIAHHGFVGDLYEILPQLLEQIEAKGAC